MRWHPLIVEQANALGKVVDGGICGTRLRGRKGAGGGIGGGRMSGLGRTLFDDSLRAKACFLGSGWGVYWVVH
jgi:hypothetical protein